MMAQDTPISQPPATSAQASTPIVEARQVTVRYGSFLAVMDLNFSVPRREKAGNFISIIGPSGCGKSTLLNLISGLALPTEGQMLVDGQPVEGPGRDRGMIFQQYSSFPHLTVLKNLLFGLEVNHREMGLDGRARMDRARGLIHEVGLEGHEHKYPHQLSGGQQQRVAIARSLALEPKILLMDEPFSALDEPTRLEMQELIVDLWHRIHPTIFCVTHSVTEAVYLGERVWIFSRAPGQIAVDIHDCIPPSPGVPPLVAQERQDFKEAARVVTEAFRQISRQKAAPTAPA